MNRGFLLFAGVLFGLWYFSRNAVSSVPDLPVELPNPDLSPDYLSQSLSTLYDSISNVFGDLMSGWDPVLNTMAEAIKTQEGWHPGSRSVRNNNPGNLRWSNIDSVYDVWPGVLGLDAQDHVVFQTYQDGWNALLKQLRLAFSGQSHVYSPDFSLFQFFQKYAEANQDSYARNVAAALGVSPDTTLAQLMG